MGLQIAVDEGSCWKWTRRKRSEKGEAFKKGQIYREKEGGTRAIAL